MREFNEALHPRAPKGAENGGEFIEKNTLALRLIKENRSILLNSIKEAFSVDDNKASEILNDLYEYIIDNPSINLNELINSRQSGVDLKMLVNRFERAYINNNVDFVVNELNKENIRIYGIKNAMTTKSVYINTDFGEIRISDHKQSIMNDKGSVKFEIYYKSDINGVIREIKKINSVSGLKDVNIRTGTILKPISGTILPDIEILSISESAFTGKKATVKNIKTGRVYDKSFDLIKKLYL